MVPANPEPIGTSLIKPAAGPTKPAVTNRPFSSISTAAPSASRMPPRRWRTDSSSWSGVMPCNEKSVSFTNRESCWLASLRSSRARSRWASARRRRRRCADSASSRSTTDGRRCGVVLQDEVLRAGLHRLERGGHVDDARDEHERHVEASLVDHAERIHAAEAREAVVGEHQVPLRTVERACQSRGVFHPLRDKLEIGARQLTHDQVGVVGVVLDEEYAERDRHATCPLGLGGASLRTSQYRPSCWTAFTNWSKSTGLRM